MKFFAANIFVCIRDCNYFSHMDTHYFAKLPIVDAKNSKIAANHSNFVCGALPPLLWKLFIAAIPSKN
ncbi:hypothetical protein [Nitrosomonas sp. Nm34]|uniref:hypothetical protein n=1 Tax=Nitrosomonas sp. Nm34 TaxID=1881055 RepID=UPI000B8739E3|nr:hypothetical protein [Nitrosomonas sp. Nm34]